MTNDPVNHPSHYTEGRNFEVIDILEDAVGRAPDPVLGALQWQALKYLNRLWDKGNTEQDAKKAMWYLMRLIDKIAAYEQDELTNEQRELCSAVLSDEIPIPYKDGPLGGSLRYCCKKSVYDFLEVGQLFAAWYSPDDTTHIQEAVYRLQKDTKNRWELVYVETRSMSL